LVQLLACLGFRLLMNKICAVAFTMPQRSAVPRCVYR
jgi:hypothetical protein